MEYVEDVVTIPRDMIGRGRRSTKKTKNRAFFSPLQAKSSAKKVTLFKRLWTKVVLFELKSKVITSKLHRQRATPRQKQRKMKTLRHLYVDRVERCRFLRLNAHSFSESSSVRVHWDSRKYRHCQSSPRLSHGVSKRKARNPSDLEVRLCPSIGNR